ncbi:MAG: iron-sulfur cluster-binding protein [Pseudomonadales bacterium]|nr:iron-sulfur cluster-binding protein [Pseudomonadales bacterium]
MDVSSKEFISLANIGLENENLQTTMNQFGANMISRRQQIVQQLPEFDQLRDEARDIKNHTLAHLDLYLEKFEQQVVANGGQVHWASSEAEAKRIIGDICHAKAAKNIIKSKSMVTEELDLAVFLEDQGLETLETDLGEYIIQLRGERPSHIVAPAVHLNKDQVADTFFKHHSQPGDNKKLSTRADLVAEARQILRSHFLAADIGITGANFLVAETGSIILVTNEGNAELTTALPETHIVVTGIEKVIPTLEDAATFIRLLTRSAVGAEISAYTSFITGAKRSADLDGAKNFHVVLVDNGRVDMLGSEFQPMLRCIRCSACLHHCPVYLSVGGHAYGSVYNGPMGAVLTPHLAGVEHAGHLPNASTFCGRCESVCPVRIPLPDLMRFWRNQQTTLKLDKPSVRWALQAWAFIVTRPRLYKIVSALLVRCLAGFTKAGFITRLPSIAGNWTESRDFRKPEQQTFISRWKKGRADV